MGYGNRRARKSCEGDAALYGGCHMKHPRRPPGYCTECQQEWPADEMSRFQPDKCWRHCTHPCERIESQQPPRVPGSAK